MAAMQQQSNCCCRADAAAAQAESTRELLSMFYGLLFAYDEGLTKSDDVLAAAVWRNLFHSSKVAGMRNRTARAHAVPRPAPQATANAVDIAAMVEYIRSTVHALDDIDSEQLLEKGGLTFGPPPHGQ